MLLQAGADRFRKDNGGVTPTDLAERLAKLHKRPIEDVFGQILEREVDPMFDEEFDQEDAPSAHEEL